MKPKLARSIYPNVLAGEDERRRQVIKTFRKADQEAIENARTYGIRFNPINDRLYLNGLGTELARDYRVELYRRSFETFCLDSQIVTTMDPRRKWDCADCDYISEGKLLYACEACGSSDVTLRDPVQTFPITTDYEYLRPVARILQTEGLLCICKSRRKLLTMIICCYCLWHTMFYRGTHVYAMSQQREDAQWLVSVIYGMWSRLPTWMKERYPANEAERGSSTKNSFKIDMQDSEVVALPQGVHKTRGKTPTILFGDEVVTWNKAEATYAAFSSAMEKGTQAIMCSSTGPGFFARLRHDELGDVQQRRRPRDNWDEYSNEVREGPSASEIQRAGHDAFEIDGGVPGMWAWKNRDNGFTVLNLHATSNPSKRSPEFMKTERKKNPQGFDAEINMDDTSLSGHRIMAEFNFRKTDANCRCIDCRESITRTGLALHSTESSVIPHVALPSWCPTFTSTDPGYKSSAWVTGVWVLDASGIWHLIYGLVARGLKVHECKARIYQLLRKDGGVPLKTLKKNIIDPASKQERAESEKSLIEKMHDRPYKLSCEPPAKRINEDLGIQEVLKMFCRRPDGLFGAYIHDTALEVGNLLQASIWTSDGRHVDDRNNDAYDMTRYLATWKMRRPLRPVRPENLEPQAVQTARRYAAFANEQRKAHRQSKAREKHETVFG